MQNEKVNKLIKNEFDLYPKAQLVDYYKLFFQGTFGPQHIIFNKTSAEKALRNEIEKSSIFAENNFQDISYINNFYRVNINVINKGIITFDSFPDAFVKSADVKNKLSYEAWVKEWEYIEKQILALKITMKNFEQQSNELEQIIKNRKLVSHSDIYRNTYHPHYRLINAEQFRRMNC